MLGATVENQTSDWLVLWSTNGQKVRYVISNLGQSFTDEWHTYKIQVSTKNEKMDIALVSRV